MSFLETIKENIILYGIIGGAFLYGVPYLTSFREVPLEHTEQSAIHEQEFQAVIDTMSSAAQVSKPLMKNYRKLKQSMASDSQRFDEIYERITKQINISGKQELQLELEKVRIDYTHNLRLIKDDVSYIDSQILKETERMSACEQSMTKALADSKFTQDEAEIFQRSCVLNLSDITKRFSRTKGLVTDLQERYLKVSSELLEDLKELLYQVAV